MVFNSAFKGIKDGWVGPKAVMVTSDKDLLTLRGIKSCPAWPQPNSPYCAIPAPNVILHLQYYPSAGYVSSHGIPSTHVFVWPISLTKTHQLTFWCRNYFFNFSTPVYKMWIIQEQNVRIMKQTAFWKEKKGEYIPCLKHSVPIFVE